jgi:hypothetical protein
MAQTGRARRFFRWLIFIGIIVTAIMTNPNKDKHIEKLNDKLYDLVPDSDKTSLVKKIGKLVSNPLLDKVVTVDNYFLFSVSRIEVMGKSETLGYGFLGMVFFTDKVNDLDY